MGNLMSLLK